MKFNLHPEDETGIKDYLDRNPTPFQALEDRLDDKGVLGQVVAVITKPNASLKLRCYGERIDVGTLQTALNREMGTWLDYFPCEAFDGRTEVHIVQGEMFGLPQNQYVGLSENIDLNPDVVIY
jgi:hypothetical protein